MHYHLHITTRGTAIVTLVGGIGWKRAVTIERCADIGQNNRTEVAQTASGPVTDTYTPQSLVVTFDLN